MSDANFTVPAYQQGLAQYKLMGAKCNDCGALHLPPRPICTTCRAQSMTWSELKGEGTIIGFTSIAIVSTDMAGKGYGRDNPYLTAIVALKNGPNVAARIEVGDDKDLQGRVRVGTPVNADFLEETVGDAKRTTLVFRPK